MKSLKVFMLIGVIIMANSHPTLSEASIACEQKWQTLSIKSFRDGEHDYSNMLVEWEIEKQACLGTGIYELKLAFLHFFLGDKESAKKIITEANIPAHYKPNQYALEINMELAEILYAEFPKKKEQALLQELIDKNLPYTEQYPKHYNLFGVIGNLYILTENFEKSVPFLLQGIKEKDAYLYGPYRNLTIAYSKTGQHEKALSAADKVYEINSSPSNDMYFVYAAAISFASQGNYKAAHTLMNLLISHHPEIKSDSEFRTVIVELREIYANGLATGKD